MKKELRSGYTTGTCAAAASKAAALMLMEERFHGKKLNIAQIRVTLPDGSVTGDLEVKEAYFTENEAVCGVIKDAGDDPDITHGMCIYARLTPKDTPGIVIDGGQGVGRVTKKGLDQPVGAAAINSVPRQMIGDAVQSVLDTYAYAGGMQVIIAIPGGEEKAASTLNPALGIVGGLSVLGTSGIVEPMSEQALIDTIGVEIRMRMAEKEKVLLMTPGNYGMDYLKESLGLSGDRAVKISNFVGESMDLALAAGAQQILLVGHIGKLIKVAGGIMNTHSRFADARMEIMTAHAALAGADSLLCRQLMDAATTDAGLELLESAGLTGQVMTSIVNKIDYYLTRRTGGKVRLGIVVFSNQLGLLGKNAQADALLETLLADAADDHLKDLKDQAGR